MAHDITHENHDSRYVKIWLILLVLLTVSIIGPMFEIQAVTLITAFGIAAVKALMVMSYFMHLNIEKRIVWYMLIISLTLVAVFYFGVAADIMLPEGHQWVDCVDNATCVLTGDSAIDAINYGIIR